ncbi:CD63 antigen [Pseudolycoriella hygida]|uniref:CD63 antigen n=1 Tax=Pseudolycoriella hygida TaxID=35572 RepID=A0A9Q0MRI5_9DIPT|nr:CD63 antigen [Pseudolycoriella hygida]
MSATVVYENLLQQRYTLATLNGLYLYRQILIGVLALQIFAFFSTLVILIFRSYIAESFLGHLMQEYHNDESIKNIMDIVQVNFECCGLQSYKDWKNYLPLSCCGASTSPCTVSLTKLLGCTENLSMFILLLCLAFLFVSTGNIVFHGYCIRCALELSREYQ